MVRIGIKHERCPLVFSHFRQSSLLKKRRMAFSGIYEAENEAVTEPGNLSSEFLGINRKTGEKVVMYTGDKTSCLIELRKRQ